MRAVDRILQRWRIREASPYVRHGDRLLDIGCYDAALINEVLPRVTAAVGVDPLVPARCNGNVTILQGTFPGELPLDPESFDCITMLALIEHVEDPVALSRACARLLKPGGRIVMTVPHPLVDYILHALVWVGASDPADLEGHHGFDLNQIERLFVDAGLRSVAQRRFQLGLNRLFVFEKPQIAA